MRRALLAVCFVLTACGGGGGGGTPADSQPAAQAEQPAPPPPPAAVDPVRVATWGDSLTVDSAGDLAALLPKTAVSTGGVGGQISTEIAARQGGVVPTLRIAADMIPAAGPVQITTQSVRMLTAEGIQQITGTLAGVHGTVSRTAADNSYWFTREAVGQAVSTSAAGEPFTVDTFGRRAWPTVFWYGRNNFYDQPQVLTDIAASVAFLEPGTKFVVLSVFNTEMEPAGTDSYDKIARLNAAIAAAYPNNFFDVRAYMVAQYDRNLATDVADHAKDVLPGSLRRDWIHMNAKGRVVLASGIRDYILSKGW